MDSMMSCNNSDDSDEELGDLIFRTSHTQPDLEMFHGGAVVSHNFTSTNKNWRSEEGTQQKDITHAHAEDGCLYIVYRDTLVEYSKNTNYHTRSKKLTRMNWRKCSRRLEVNERGEWVLSLGE